MLLVEGSKLNFTFLPKHGEKLSLIWLGTRAKWCEIYSEKGWFFYLPIVHRYLKLFITYRLKKIQFRTESKCFLKNTTKTQGEHNDAKKTKKNPLKNPVKHIKITRFTKAKHRSIIHNAILRNLWSIRYIN